MESNFFKPTINYLLWIIPIILFFIAIFLNSKIELKTEYIITKSYERIVAFLIDLSVCLAVYCMIAKGFKEHAFYLKWKNILPYIMFWVYFPFFESLKMSSIGKFFIGIEVRSIHGKRVNLLQTCFRFLLFNISTMGFCLGVLMIPFTKHKQGMHDLLSNTIVTKKTHPAGWIRGRP